MQIERYKFDLYKLKNLKLNYVKNQTVNKQKEFDGSGAFFSSIYPQKLQYLK